MASNNILDEELRRETNRNRFSTHLERTEVAPTTQALSRSLPRIMSEFNFGSMSVSDVNKLTIAMRAEFGTTWSTMWRDISDNLLEMAQLEAEAVTGVYQDFTPDTLVAPTQKQVAAGTKAAVMTLTTDVSQSGTWAQFVRQNNTSTMRGIAGIIRDGYANQLSYQETLEQLRGKYDRKTKKYVGGFLNGKARAGADALTRTGVSHYANVARDEFAVKNKDVIQGRTLFATLDNTTTTICLGRHLNFYPNGEPFPNLPFHFNERSQYIFKTKGFDALNTDRTAVGGQKGDHAAEKFETKQGRTDKKVKYKGRKDSDVFDIQTIEAKVTSDQWLRRQPKWFVDSTLGTERAKLFLKGDLKIDRFTDMTGRQLTLKELKETNAGAKAFRKADK
jgi:hypothetical protein